MSACSVELCDNEMSCLDPPVDLVIEVKGSRTNVTVSWDGKKKEGEADDLEMETDAHDQKVDTGKKGH